MTNHQCQSGWITRCPDCRDFTDREEYCATCMGFRVIDPPFPCPDCAFAGAMTQADRQAWMAANIGVGECNQPDLGGPCGGKLCSGKQWLFRKACPGDPDPDINETNQMCHQGTIKWWYDSADKREYQCPSCHGLSYIYARPDNGFSDAVRALGWDYFLSSDCDDAGDGIQISAGDYLIHGEVDQTEGLTGDAAIETAISRAYLTATTAMEQGTSRSLEQN